MSFFVLIELLESVVCCSQFTQIAATMTNTAATSPQGDSSTTTSPEEAKEVQNHEGLTISTIASERDQNGKSTTQIATPGTIAKIGVKNTTPASTQQTTSAVNKPSIPSQGKAVAYSAPSSRAAVPNRPTVLVITPGTMNQPSKVDEATIKSTHQVLKPIPPLPSTISKAISSTKNPSQQDPLAQPSKKRKPNPPPPQPPQQQVSLVDPSIVQTVHDLLELLQIYGPLTKSQLEFNLPPSRHVADIVDLLVALGVVQVVNIPSNAISEPIYCVFAGRTRQDAVLPHQALSQLETAHSQYQHSLERAHLLKEYLKNPSTSPRVLFQSMLKAHESEMANDPVYVTALKHFGLDIGPKPVAGKPSSAKKVKK
jgi:hypothetical protein